jgi:hypothetical protein
VTPYTPARAPVLKNTIHRANTSSQKTDSSPRSHANDVGAAGGVGSSPNASLWLRLHQLPTLFVQYCNALTLAWLTTGEPWASSSTGIHPSDMLLGPPLPRNGPLPNRSTPYSYPPASLGSPGTEDEGSVRIGRLALRISVGETLQNLNASGPFAATEIV